MTNAQIHQILEDYQDGGIPIVFGDPPRLIGTISDEVFHDLDMQILKRVVDGFLFKEGRTAEMISRSNIDGRWVVLVHG